VGALRAEVEAAYPGAEERIVFQEIVRRLVNDLASGLIEGTQAAAAESDAESWRDVRRLPRRIARMTADAAATDANLKSLLRRRVYYSEALVAERKAAAAQVARLFQHYVEKPAAMPENYLRQTGSTPVYRVVCDYVAGMTDRYFRGAYREVFGAG
jgi:dGTPase